MHTYNSYLTVIGVHEMHGRMHPNYCQIRAVWYCNFSISILVRQNITVFDIITIMQMPYVCRPYKKAYDLQ